MLALGALVHEMLHAVETNSRANGIDTFQPLHNVEENGYKFEFSNLLWYHDLMTNTLKNGRQGFTPGAYYVSHQTHYNGDGTYRDYDGVTRTYVNGIPQ